MEVCSRWGAKRSALPLREYDVARADQRIEPSLDPWAAVEQFRSLARKAFGRSFKGLILYGSYARGEQDAGSDVDILVLFKDKAAVERGRQKLSELAGDLSLKRGEGISAMPLAEAEYRRGRSPFFLNVKREGIFIMSEEAFEVRPEIEQLLELADVSLAAARSLFREEEEFARFAATMLCSILPRPSSYPRACRSRGTPQ